MRISLEIKARLHREVRKQSMSERKKIMRSSGMPHYRVPRSMVSEPMACCCVYAPCKIHKKFLAA